MKVPEIYRVRHGVFGTTANDGNNGVFEIPHYKIAGYIFYLLISDGEGWEHVSVTVGQKGKPAHRCPTWLEMCWIKDQFWNKDEVVVQYHPAQEDYVSNHDFCLHLWKPTDFKMLTPPTYLVGIPNKL